MERTTKGWKEDRIASYRLKKEDLKDYLKKTFPGNHEFDVKVDFLQNQLNYGLQS